MTNRNKNDYIGCIGLIIAIAFLIGMFVYYANDWKGDKFVSEYYVGVIKKIYAKDRPHKYGRQVIIVVDDGRHIVLSRFQPEEEWIWQIKKGQKVWIHDAILNGGRSNLHRQWISVEMDNIKRYYIIGWDK